MKKTLLALLATVAALSLVGTASAKSGPSFGATATSATNTIPQVMEVDNSPSAFFKQYVDWMTKKSKGAGTYSVGYTMVSNQKDNVATYAEGSMKYFLPLQLPISPTPVRQVGQIGTVQILSAKLAGDGVQYFNNRLFDLNMNCPVPNDGDLHFANNINPFDPTQTDKVNASFEINTGKITLTLKSHGNQKIEMNGVCDTSAGLIYGIAAGGPVNPKVMCVFSFSKNFLPEIH